MAGKELTPEQQAELKRVLDRLPESVAGQMATAIEIDRLKGGSKLPHNLILAGTRGWRRLNRGWRRRGQTGLQDHIPGQG